MNFKFIAGVAAVTAMAVASMPLFTPARAADLPLVSLDRGKCRDYFSVAECSIILQALLGDRTQFKHIHWWCEEEKSPPAGWLRKNGFCDLGDLMAKKSLLYGDKTVPAPKPSSPPPPPPPPPPSHGGGHGHGGGHHNGGGNDGHGNGHNNGGHHGNHGGGGHSDWFNGAIGNGNGNGNGNIGDGNGNNNGNTIIIDGDGNTVIISNSVRKAIMASAGM